MKKAALLIFVSALLAACESTTLVDSAARIGVRLATTKIVENNPQFRERIVEIADGLARNATGIAAISVSALEKLVRDEIDWQKIRDTDPQLEIIVDELIIAVRNELIARLGAGELEPAQALVVSNVAGWIRDAALSTMIRPFGPGPQ